MPCMQSPCCWSEWPWIFFEDAVLNHSDCSYQVTIWDSGFQSPQKSNICTGGDRDGDWGGGPKGNTGIVVLQALRNILTYPIHKPFLCCSWLQSAVGSHFWFAVGASEHGVTKTRSVLRCSLEPTSMEARLAEESESNDAFKCTLNHDCSLNELFSWKFIPPLSSFF